jgi:hypothetical protein
VRTPTLALAGLDDCARSTKVTAFAARGLPARNGLDNRANGDCSGAGLTVAVRLSFGTGVDRGDGGVVGIVGVVLDSLTDVRRPELAMNVTATPNAAIATM